MPDPVVNTSSAKSEGAGIGLASRTRHPGIGGRPWPALGVIAAGGALGALARYALMAAWPHAPSGFPWAVFVINVSGCLLIGALMVGVTEVWVGRPLIRPFLGVGVLGGFTTFSTYAVDAQQLLAAGRTTTAMVYLVGTMLAALIAVVAGDRVATVLLAAIRRRARREEQS